MSTNFGNCTILDSIADGVFTIDMDFKITSLNRAAREIMGIEEDDALGKLCFEVFHASICEHSCAMKQTLNTGKNVLNKTVYIVNSKGIKVPISISTALLKDENGEIIGGVETFRDISEIERLRNEIEKKYSFEDIISKNKTMTDLFAILPDIAQSDTTVLIQGASGTGKELIARAIHSLSGRKKSPLTVINCAALPGTLLESELFGYKAGAFTDAKKDKPGKIALAEGGTVFLDEVAEISTALQVKLLRFLQEREYEPLGGTTPVKSDVRIISATNKVLIDEVNSGGFRDDLYYRLNVINIELPRLMDRKEDVPPLVGHFIRKYNDIKGKNIEGVTDEVMTILMDYDYPGNIRELENIIEHAFVLCRDSYIGKTHLPQHHRSESAPVNESMTLAEIERLYMLRALERNNGNRSKTARDLGIDSSTLWRKLKKYDIE